MAYLVGSVWFVVTIGVGGLLLREVEWATLCVLSANVRWGLTVLGITLVLTSYLINAARWQYLLQHRATGYGTRC